MKSQGQDGAASQAVLGRSLFNCYEMTNLTRSRLSDTLLYDTIHDVLWWSSYFHFWLPSAHKIQSEIT